MQNETDFPWVTIEKGLSPWQILQQNGKGTASISLAGTWRTAHKRARPEVRLRLCREGTLSPIGRRFDWATAETRVNLRSRGKDAGKSGTWHLTLKNIPAGGPYRLDTSIGSSEDAIEWRRSGEVIHFVGVGDIWLIAGQSNAEGYGASPVEDPSQIGVHEFRGGAWLLAAQGHRHHPWLAFAKKIMAERGYPVGLIPTAVGGTPVRRWQPGRGGDLFRRMKERVLAAGGDFRGVLWYQGESDTDLKDCPKYEARFSRFVTGVRRLAKSADLPIITVQLNRTLGNAHQAEGWERIREVQRGISHRLESTFLFSIFDSILCDGIHNGSPSNVQIGLRAAQVALGGVYGRDIAFRHPECSSARKVSVRKILLSFDNVVGRLDCPGLSPEGGAFAVSDREGEVPIAGLALHGKNRCTIKLTRDLRGEASVTGAPGTSPPHNLPKDISGYRPMLAFTLPVK